MARPLSTSPDPQEQERLLQRLLSLYAEEKRIYQRVLSLSRNQVDRIRRGESIQSIHEILQEKKDCLDSIARLERAEGGTRALWERGRSNWTGKATARLHEQLHEVGAVIEEILLCEEENDRMLLEKAEA